MTKHFPYAALFLAVMLFLLSACTPLNSEPPGTEPSAQQTLSPTLPTVVSPTQPTAVQETEPVESLPDVQLLMDTGVIPLLIGTYPVDFVGENAATEKQTSVTVSYTGWDLQQGVLVSPVPWYQQSINSWLQTNIAFWAGDTHIVSWGQFDPLVQGITIDRSQSNDLYFGTTMNKTLGSGIHALSWIHPDGAKQEIVQPKSPKDICREDAWLQDWPLYAWTDGATVSVFYLAKQGSEIDIIYTTYPFDSPESAQWETVSAPSMQANNLFTNGTCAYHQGKLYAGSLKGIVELDTVSGEILVLDETNLFCDVFNIYPNAHWHKDPMECEMYVVGCWNDTLIFETAFWTDEEEGEKYHEFYVAVKNGEIQGVMERSDWGLFTFYDKDLNVLGTDDRYQLTLEPYCVKFPLEG